MLFGSEHESVVPDMMVLGKGLTGWYLPLAVTLISEKLFSAFNGSVAQGKALAYGQSYTGNALGCAAAKASLEVFEKEGVLEALQPKIRDLSSALAGLRELPGKGSAPVRIYCRNRDGRLSGSRGARHGRSRLHRSATPRLSDQTNFERRRSDAALVHHDRAVNQSRRSPPRVDHRGLAVQQTFREKR